MGRDKCLYRFQTALHGILSTRIVLHTARVFRQEVVDSRAPVAPNRQPSSMRFAAVTIGLVPEDVEVYETQR